MKKVNTEVIICEACKGNGHQFHDKLVDYHRGIYDIEKKECWDCKATGRMIRETTIVLKPFE